MKTSKSGNGVKVASHYKVLTQICGSYWAEYKVNNLKSNDLLIVWDYKAEGFTLPNAKAELLKAIQLRTQKHINKPQRFTEPAPGKYLGMAIERKRVIANFVKTYESLEPAQRYFAYSYGNYRYQSKSFQVHGSSYKYPVIACITWSEEHDWEFYAKSYKFPKSTYCNRMVEFSTIVKGKVEIIFSYPLNAFSGNFMEKALAAFFKVGKVKCAKDLKPVQLNDFFRIDEYKAINGYRLFQRFIGPLLWDYAIIDTKTGLTYHAYKEENLVTGLRAKMEAKFDSENEIITKETGFKLHFCESGMRAFCEINNLDYEGKYTRQELRNIVVKNRAANMRFRNDLRLIGIPIGKK